uniref:Uncharacterized protein n=1 Tax=Rousettus aegyptiacus TaxID=9407 RepID=A0A7J8IMP2_ROUAE|nr:hypothetical protein HJG63_010635 [Rousettus aegyptiacus]
MKSKNQVHKISLRCFTFFSSHPLSGSTFLMGLSPLPDRASLPWYPSRITYYQHQKGPPGPNFWSPADLTAGTGSLTTAAPSGAQRPCASISQNVSACTHSHQALQQVCPLMMTFWFPPVFLPKRETFSFSQF